VVFLFNRVVFGSLLLAQKAPKKSPKFLKKYPISAQKNGLEISIDGYIF